MVLHRKVNTALIKHLKELATFKELDKNWHWYRTRLGELEKIDKGLIEIIRKTHIENSKSQFLNELLKRLYTELTRIQNATHENLDSLSEENERDKAVLNMLLRNIKVFIEANSDQLVKSLQPNSKDKDTDTVAPADKSTTPDSDDKLATSYSRLIKEIAEDCMLYVYAWNFHPSGNKRVEGKYAFYLHLPIDIPQIPSSVRVMTAYVSEYEQANRFTAGERIYVGDISESEYKEKKLFIYSFTNLGKGGVAGENGVPQKVGVDYSGRPAELSTQIAIVFRREYEKNIISFIKKNTELVFDFFTSLFRSYANQKDMIDGVDFPQGYEERAFNDITNIQRDNKIIVRGISEKNYRGKISSTNHVISYTKK